MNITSLETRTSSYKPSFDISNERGQFFLNVNSFVLGLGLQSPPEDLDDWSVRFISSSVRALYSDINESVDFRFTCHELSHHIASIFSRRLSQGPLICNIEGLFLTVAEIESLNTEKNIDMDTSKINITLINENGDRNRISLPKEETMENLMSKLKNKTPLISTLTDSSIVSIVMDIKNQMPQGTPSIVTLFVATSFILIANFLKAIESKSIDICIRDKNLIPSENSGINVTWENMN